VYGNRVSLTGTVRGTARRPHFSGHYLRNRSTLDMGVWVISVCFNIRNALPKSDTFLLGHPVYDTVVPDHATKAYT
jgi:hypothetical protein